MLQYILILCEFLNLFYVCFTNKSCRSRLCKRLKKTFYNVLCYHSDENRIFSIIIGSAFIPLSTAFMNVQIPPSNERLPAMLACCCQPTAVRPDHVFVQVARFTEQFPAEPALVRFGACMDHHVSANAGRLRETATAHVAFVSRLICVSQGARIPDQVVWSNIEFIWNVTEEQSQY